MKRAHFILISRVKRSTCREKIFSLFLTTQNAERSKPSQICSDHAPFWTTNKAIRSGAIPSISKTVVFVVVVVAMVVVVLFVQKTHFDYLRPAHLDFADVYVY